MIHYFEGIYHFVLLPSFPTVQKVQFQINFLNAFQLHFLSNFSSSIFFPCYIFRLLEVLMSDSSHRNGWRARNTTLPNLIHSRLYNFGHKSPVCWGWTRIESKFICYNILTSDDFNRKMFSFYGRSLDRERRGARKTRCRENKIV